MQLVQNSSFLEDEDKDSKRHGDIFKFTTILTSPATRRGDVLNLKAECPQQRD